MIRYKEKEFEDYSICPATGDIFNAKTGEVQETYLCQGRSIFKGMPVHRIMAHTYLGYKPSFEVHHLDENKFNNALSNLVYLTGAEHRRLHHEGKHYSEETRAKLSLAFKGRHHSEETRAKLSTSLKGKPTWIKGRHLSEETRVKMSLAHKGKLKSEETKTKMSLAFKGKQLSEETRAKMSSAHKGRHLSEETRAKISAAIKNRRKN